MNICILLHTHCDYKDILYIAVDRLNKYGPKYDIYVLSNYYSNCIPNDKTIIYNDTMSFAQRINNATKILPYNYILLMRDSDILVGETDMEKLKLIEETIIKHDIDCIRLNNSGIEDSDLNNNLEGDCYVININSPYLFSLYPTIWKKNSLMQLMNEFIEYKYYDLESQVLNEYCKRFYNCFVYNSTSKIRQYNERYSHIIKFIHILQHGKWTYVHDPNYVLDIQKEYNIDLNIRGFHKSNYRRPSQTNGWNPYT